MSLESREDLLVRVATLYYEHDMNQEQIARLLDKTRSNISRMLKEARERGIVEIRIRKRIPQATVLEREFRKAFGLHAALIVQSNGRGYDEMLAEAGTLAAQHLEEKFRPGDTLAISWGTGVSSAVNAISPNSALQIDVAQMIGSVGTVDSGIDGPELARQLATKLGGAFYYLHAPLIVDSSTTRNAFLEQSTIRDTITRARRAKIAIVGIGTTESAASSFLRAGHLTEAQLADLRRQGAVGESSGCYFDAFGRTEQFGINDRVVGLSLKEVGNIPYVLAVSCGLLKKRSILGTLRGGYIHALATDDATAAAVLEESRQV
ncbi:MAG: sugar-binding transcriptional regulator [Anaerolineae bacterium]|nr:sugar-binding transcriptional regulator [Anaerolineae bacterium]